MLSLLFKSLQWLLLLRTINSYLLIVAPAALPLPLTSVHKPRALPSPILTPASTSGPHLANSCFSCTVLLIPLQSPQPLATTQTLRDFYLDT